MQKILILNKADMRYAHRDKARLRQDMLCAAIVLARIGPDEYRVLKNRFGLANMRVNSHWLGALLRDCTR